MKLMNFFDDIMSGRMFRPCMAATILIGALAAMPVSSALAGVWKKPGARNVAVDIETENGTNFIAVSFAPVKSFDKAKNRELNVRFSRAYALWGLEQEVGCLEKERLVADGMRLMATEQTANSFEAGFCIGVDDIDVVEATDSTGKASRAESLLAKLEKLMEALEITKRGTMQ